MLKVCCRNCSEEECECVCECECDCECCSSGFECSRKCFFTWIYVLITVAFLVSAIVIFKAFPTTDKANTPEKSRNENVECIYGSVSSTTAISGRFCLHLLCWWEHTFWCMPAILLPATLEVRVPLTGRKVRTTTYPWSDCASVCFPIDEKKGLRIEMLTSG